MIIAGKHGNIVIARINLTRLIMLVFSRDGKKLLTRSFVEIKMKFKNSAGEHHLEMSPGGRFVFVGHEDGSILAFEIVQERFLKLKAGYNFTRRILTEEGKLTHIFCYKERKLIGLINLGRKLHLKFLVFGLDEEKGALRPMKVKGAEEFAYKGNVRFYRKGGKVYFRNHQKEGACRLIL